MPDPVETKVLITQVSETARIAGFTAGTYEVMRIGTNSVLCDWEHGVVVRVTSTDCDPDVLNQWLCTVIRLAKAGAPVLPPLHESSIQVNSHQYATFWPLANIHPKLSSIDLASLISGFHSVKIHPDDRPWSYVERCKSRLMNIAQSSITDSVIEQLNELVGRELMLADLQASSNPVLVHGDAHPNNVLVYEGKLVLIDLDNVGSGPREIDLAPYAVSCRRFPALQKSWNKFLSSYPFTVDRELLARLIRIS